MLFPALFVAGILQPVAHAARVVLPDDEPAAGARAVPLTTTHFLRIDGLEFLNLVEKDITLLNEDGALEITGENAGRWVILHPLGYADLVADAETETIRLEKWETLSGRVDVAGETDGRVSFARSERPRRRDDKGGSIYWTTGTEIAEDGSFTIPHVPRGFGQVGLMREHRHERRITNWRDYPQAVTVPQTEAVVLGGGIALLGRVDLPSEYLPALLSIAPRAARPPCYGVTDEAGNFQIPGVLPGEYRLTARGLLGQSSEKVLNLDFAILADQTEAGLGTLSQESPPFVLEIDRRVETTPDLLERILAAASRHSSAQIQTVWIGETVHPTGVYGARVNFAAEVEGEDPTRASQPLLVLEIPGESFRKFYPAHDSLCFGYRYSDEPFLRETLHQRKLRVFPLATTTLFVPLEEDGTYAEVLALLQAIEQGTIEVPSTKQKRDEGGWSFTFRGQPPNLDDLQKLDRIRVEKNGKITLSTREAPFRGRTFHFEKTGEGNFRFTGSGGWVS